MSDLNFIGSSMSTSALSEPLANLDFFSTLEPSHLSSPSHPAYIAGKFFRKQFDSFVRRISNVKNVTYFFNKPAFNLRNEADPLLQSLFSKTIVSSLSDHDLSLIKAFMDIGARAEPRYNILLDKDEYALIELLHRYKIYPNTKEYKRIHQIPCLHNRKNNLDYFISLITDQNQYKLITQEIKRQRNYFSKIIDHAFLAAKKNEKPLLILLGESHYSIDISLINELILLKLLSEKFKLDTIMTEASSKKFGSKYQDYSCMTESGDIIISDHVEEAMTSLNITKKPIDFFLFNETKIDLLEQACLNIHDNSSCLKLNEEIKKIKEIDYSTENIIQDLPKRNHVMADIMIRAPKKNIPILAIVGAHHLYGLINESELPQHYHILAIDVSSDKSKLISNNKGSSAYYLNQYKQFLVSGEVTSVPKLSSIAQDTGLFVTPKFLSDVALGSYSDYNDFKLKNNNKKRNKP